MAEQLARELERGGLSVELRFTQARGDARGFAAAARQELLVSVGGDGTLREVLGGHARRDVPVAILPLGTANVLALDLGLPTDPRRAAGLIEQGHSTALDTARVGDELSFLAVSAGFDARAVHAVERRRRGPISKLSYVSAGLDALRGYQERAMRVEIDGRELPQRFAWVIVANVIRYAGVFPLSRSRELGDGRWEVYLFERAARRHLPFHLLRGLAGRWGARACLATRVRIQSAEPDQPVEVQLDGDAHATTPVALDVDGPRFRIVCPARLADG